MRLDGRSALLVLVSQCLSRLFHGLLSLSCLLQRSQVFAELLHDVSRRFAPFDVDTAREMIAEIKAAPLLTGYRGRAPLDIAALAETLARVSQLACDHADRIQEIDINPVFVRAAGQSVRAADALIVLKAGND